jgi:hypothetical protein
MSPTVAVIGASADRTKFGNKSVRAHVQAGFQVFPVHPRESTIEGLTAFRSVREIPLEQLDRVTLYLPATPALAVLNDIALQPPRELWLNPGADDPAVVAKAKSLLLTVIVGCSIVALGISPSDLD